jgi:hypothetical protein
MNQPRRVPMGEARASLRDLVKDVNGTPERIKITRYDRTIAGLVSPADLQLLDDCKHALAARERNAQQDGAPAALKVKRTARPRRGRSK